MTSLKENVRGIESRWAKVIARLQKKLLVVRSENEDGADPQIAKLKDFTSLNLSPSHQSQNHALKEEDDEEKHSPHLLKEFKTAFQEVSSWIETAESKLVNLRLNNRDSEERELGKEIEDMKPKISDLRAMAEKLVEMFVKSGAGKDVEPDMKMLGLRWGDLVLKVENRLKTNREFKMVEVEEIKTTISHLTIPTTVATKVVTSHTHQYHTNGSNGSNGNGHYMDEDEIDTLPEEDSLPSSSKSLKRPLPAELDLSAADRSFGKKSSSSVERESSLLSSRDSSPDQLEIVTGTMILQSNSPTFIKETVSKIPRPNKALPPKTLPKPKTPSPISSPVKTPPKTLPKPQWFSLHSNSSPEKVKVVSNTLPSPQKAQSPSRLATKEGEKEEEDTEKKVIDEENVAIERLLKEAHSDLAEVKKKASFHSQTKNAAEMQERDIIDFEDSATNILRKIERAKGKLNQLDFETDLRLRDDLIGMEAKMIEAEVATLISRGDTLVLMTHRDDVTKADELQDRVTKLRCAWQALKRLADSKSEATVEAEDNVKRFKEEVERLKVWLKEIRPRVEKVNSLGIHSSSAYSCSSSIGNQEDPLPSMAKVLVREIEKKRTSVERLERLADRLKADNALGNPVSTEWVHLHTQWEEINDRMKKFSRDSVVIATTNSEISDPQSSPSISGGSYGASNAGSGSNNQTNKSAAEIVTRISKMRDAVAAVDRQLKTQVLSNKQYENLPLQATALETAKSALEKLRPTIKKTAKDLEALTGSLSVEYLEKIVGQSEKLRDEWQEVNRKYSERQVLWTESTFKHKEYFRRHGELDEWLEDAERALVHAATASNLSGALQEQHKIEKQVSEKNKEVTDLAVLGKEILPKTSAQEHVEIQTNIDRMLKRWKFVLSQLASQREKFNKERLVNNVNYMSHWLDENMEIVAAPTNISEKEEMTQTLATLKSYENESLPEKSKQMEKLTSSSSSSSALGPDVQNKLKEQFHAFRTIVPNRRKEIEERIVMLDSVSFRLRNNQSWVDQTLRNLEEARRKDSASQTEKIRASLSNKERESVGQMLEDCAEIECQVIGNKLEMNEELASRIQKFRSDWEQAVVNCSRKQQSHKIDPAKKKTSTLEREAKKKPTRNSAEVIHKAPQIFASLRDHRDWIRRKRGELNALRLAGSVESLQRQADDHQAFG